MKSVLINLKDEIRARRVMTSRVVCDLLNVSSGTLKKYRDNGLIGFSQVGDKVWFTWEQVDDFLKANEFPRVG